MENAEKLIYESLMEFMNLDCINNKTEKSSNRLVFPAIRNKKRMVRRVSEQEAVFLFAKMLEQAEQNQFLYSVETPTTKKYRFSGDNTPTIDEVNGVSGNIDICLYENGERKHLIEFKALNPNQKSYSKDFLKLMYDEVGLTNYFVQVLKNTTAGTLPNIERKYDTAIKNAIKEGGTAQSHLRIFLCDMTGKRIILYGINGKSVEVICDTNMTACPPTQSFCS
jgi:hypothetical protein